MHDHIPSSGGRPLQVGSLFTGYCVLDLAVEHVFNAETAWFSEMNEPVARIFAHHWPDAPNLGDITRIDWNTVEPVDILCGGFPCQDISKVGQQAGLAPSTRPGLWSFMAEAIEALQPGYVVIENVRGLLSARAARPQMQGATPDDRNSSQHGTRPMASGRPASSTSSGDGRHLWRPGRPRAICTMDRHTGFGHRRSSPPFPRLHPRPQPCSGHHSLRTHPAAGRASNG